MIVCGDFDPAITTEYDRVAHMLSAYGIQFHGQTRPPLPLVTVTDATPLAALVRTGLQANPASPLFYFGHGRKRPAALIGRGGAVILDHASRELLRNRLICATACHSADGLGRELRELDVSLLGYRGKLQVILEQPWATRMQAAVLAGPLALLRGATIEAAKEEASAAYDRLAEEFFASENPTEVVLGPFVEQDARAVDFTGSATRRMEVTPQ